MKIIKFKVHIGEHQGMISNSMIEIDENQGLYLGTSTNYYRKSGSYVKDIIDSSIINEPTITQIRGKSIYRFPKLDLPRQKVDHLKQSANVSVTRNKDKADYHVISEKLLDGLFDSSWKSFSEYEDFKSTIESIQSCFTNDAYIKIQNHIQQDKVHFMEVYTNWNNQNPYSDKIKSAISKLTQREGYDIYVPYKFLDEYNKLKSNPKLIFDSHINSLCNEGLHVLTEEECYNLEKILGTHDVDNLTLALEMMANCNLDKSFDYVSYLYYFNHDKLKMASNWSNINAKTLRKALSNFIPYGNASALYYEAYIKKLIAANKLTEWAFKATAKKLFDGGMKSFGLNKDVFTIKLENIELNPKYVDALKKAESAEELIQELTGDPIDDLPF